MIGLARTTVSPSSSIMIRSTPWVDGCCGPMLMTIVWDSPSTSGHGPPVTTISDCWVRSCAPSSVWRSSRSCSSSSSMRWMPGPTTGASSGSRIDASSSWSLSVVSVVSLIAGPGRP